MQAPSGRSRSSVVSITTVVPVKNTVRPMWVNAPLNSSQPTCWCSESHSENTPDADSGQRRACTIRPRCSSSTTSDVRSQSGCAWWSQSRMATHAVRTRGMIQLIFSALGSTPVNAIWTTRSPSVDSVTIGASPRRSTPGYRASNCAIELSLRSLSRSVMAIGPA